MGHNAHRLSLEWSRIEPEPGRWDEAALARYQQIFTHARREGLTLMATLNHIALPRWVAKDGGWSRESIIERFAAYARHCVEHLGEHVDLWATLSEPNIVAILGYGQHRWPPGLASGRAMTRALRFQLKAHTAAYQAIHAVQRDARVGLVLNMPLFEAAVGRPRNRLMATLEDWTVSGAILLALKTDRLLPPLSLRPRVLPALRESYDWLGLNYYGRFEVRVDPLAPRALFRRHVQTPTQASVGRDWGQIYADGLTRQLRRLASFDVPIYVTENGVFGTDDDIRSAYIVDHIRAMHRAMQYGTDVRGYFHWTLVDNFEWTEGWSAPFGLLQLDRETGARQPRPSAKLYRRICRNNGL